MTENILPKTSAAPYDGGITSDNFLKRAFAIWGHFMVAYLIIALATFAVVMVFALFFGALLGLAL